MTGDLLSARRSDPPGCHVRSVVSDRALGTDEATMSYTGKGSDSGIVTATEMITKQHPNLEQSTPYKVQMLLLSLDQTQLNRAGPT